MLIVTAYGIRVSLLKLFLFSEFVGISLKSITDKRMIKCDADPRWGVFDDHYLVVGQI